MVIGDNHLHARRLGRFRFLNAGNAAIHRHQHLVIPGQGQNGGHIQAVALPVPVGDIGNRLQAQPLQRVGKQRRGAHPVHIVIPVHRHALACRPGRPQNFRRLRDSRQRKRGQQLLPPRMQKSLGLLRRAHAPGKQQRLHKGRQPPFPLGRFFPRPKPDSLHTRASEIRRKNVKRGRRKNGAPECEITSPCQTGQASEK